MKTERGSDGAGWLLPVVLALLVGLLSVDGRSLWTDELGTWALTVPPTLSAWAGAFWRHFNSDGQIPLYHAFMWVWVQLFGADEWVLRAANVPWLALALAGCARMSDHAAERSWLLLCFCVNAFVWYYVNDARPYIVFLAGACWTVAGTLALCRVGQGGAPSAEQGLRWFLLGAVVLIGGSVIGAFWLAGMTVALAVFWPTALSSAWRAARHEWRAVLLALLVGGGLLLVAVHSHLTGARASQLASFSWAGFLYGLIELLGAAGLGPSRNELRVQLRATDPLQLAAMGALAVLSAGAVVVAWWQIASRRARAAALTAAALPLLMMVGLGLLLHWRVVGRHLSALLPLLFLAQARFLQHSFGPQGLWPMRWLGGVLVLGMLASSLSVRWLPRHEKDDYQTATRWAQEGLVQGKRVLWIADPRGLMYHGMASPVKEFQDTMPKGLLVYSHFDATSPPDTWPDTIVFSPREGIDPGNKARPLLQSGQYRQVDQAPAFERHERITAAQPYGSPAQPVQEKVAQ